MEPLDKMLGIIEEIAKGNYSNDIMELTSDDQPETIRRISEAIGMMMVKLEAREYKLSLLIDELKELNEAVKKNTIDAVSSLAAALGKRDPYTEGHTIRVSELAVKIGRHMGLGNEDLEFLKLGGILHDIGKIGFPDKLFQNHDKKVPRDMVLEIMKHPKAGADILNDLEFIGPALDYVHCHHERPDGKGYPRGLTADEIPLGAKILAVADTYDAITTDRPYQKGSSKEKALEILNGGADTKWGTECVKALNEILNS